MNFINNILYTYFEKCVKCVVTQSVTHEQSHRDISILISIPYLDYYSNYAYR